MPTITRTWLAFAAIGTGLIHFALVLGSPLALGIALAVLGLAEFGWGVLTFARETLVAPRVALVVAIVPVAGWTLLLVTSSVSESPELAASLRFLPLAVASLFELFAVAVLGVHLRRRRARDAVPAPSSSRGSPRPRSRRPRPDCSARPTAGRATRTSIFRTTATSAPATLRVT